MHDSLSQAEGNYVGTFELIVYSMHYALYPSEVMLPQINNNQFKHSFSTRCSQYCVAKIYLRDLSGLSLAYAKLIKSRRNFFAECFNVKNRPLLRTCMDKYWKNKIQGNKHISYFFFYSPSCPSVCQNVNKWSFLPIFLSFIYFFLPKASPSSLEHIPRWKKERNSFGYAQNKESRSANVAF